MPRVTNTITRTLVGIATTAASLGIGVYAARAISPADEAAVNANKAIVVDADTIQFADDAAASTSTSVEGLPSDAAGEYMAGGDSFGSGGASGVAGLPTVDVGNLLYADDPVEGISLLRQRAFDNCAGSSEGATPGPGCPLGFAGVLGGTAPPAPYLWGTPGRYLVAPSAPFPEACPVTTGPAGAAHNAITVFSRTPLESLDVKWRQYSEAAIDDPWDSLTVSPATPSAETRAWMTRFETEGYDREAFGYLTLCGILIDRDPDVPYEVLLEATDSFGRPVTSRTFVMPDGTPSGRPPTQVSIHGDRVFISAWAPPTGTVAFDTRNGTLSEDACTLPLAEGAADEGRITESVTLDDQVFVSPYGVYDPTFTRRVTTWIPLPTRPLYFCTTISDGGAAPLAIDAHLIQGATRKSPWVNFHFDTGNGEIRAGDLKVTLGSPEYDCGPSWTLDRTFGRFHYVSSSLSGNWVCPSLPSDTRLEVPVYVEFRRDGRWVTGLTMLTLETGAEDEFPRYLTPIHGMPRRAGGVCLGDSVTCAQPNFRLSVYFPELGVPGGPTAVLVYSEERV